MSHEANLTYRQLLKRLRRYGVIAMDEKRGRGSERILVLPDSPGSDKGPQYPIKYHGEGTPLGKGTIRAVLRRFGIDPKGFWQQKK